MLFVKALLIEHHTLSLNYVKKCVYNVDLREYSMWIHFGSMQLRSINIKVFKLAIWYLYGNCLFLLIFYYWLQPRSPCLFIIHGVYKMCTWRVFKLQICPEILEEVSFYLCIYLLLNFGWLNDPLPREC